MNYYLISLRNDVISYNAPTDNKNKYIDKSPDNSYIKTSISNIEEYQSILCQTNMITQYELSLTHNDALHIECHTYFFIKNIFNSINFTESQLILCTFYHCSFHNCIFYDTTLKTVGFFNCIFNNCKIYGSILDHSRFIDAKIHALFIDDCSVHGTIFYCDEKYKKEVTLQNCNIEDAYFNE